MKKYVRPPAKEKISKQEAQGKGKGVEKAEAEIEIKEQAIKIEDDRDLDYTKMENVDKILTKYKNQQTSRKNFDPDGHVEIFNLILQSQKGNLQVQIEVTMLLISTFFSASKKTIHGFFTREVWLITLKTINSLIELL
jgi:hypothetical protein